MSFETLTSVGRRLNWCGRQYHVMRYGEYYVALRSQRTNHVLHCEYTSTGENLPFLEEEYEIATESKELEGALFPLYIYLLKGI